jgi:DNA polymerase-3 subunit epsilon
MARGDRWVVLDVETTGLSVDEDCLLSIGAVSVHGDRVVLADSFEILVRTERPSERSNILVHGIGAEAQLAGVEPPAALEAFLEFVGTAPLVAYHATFDRGFLTRAARNWLGLKLGNTWLDLAELAPALLPEVKAKALDDWLVHFDIRVDQRHDAASDALATAMLLLRLRAIAPAAERDAASLIKLATAARWLGAR